MILIIEDVEYKGKYIERCGFEMPGVKDFEYLPFDKLEIYMKETLDELAEE